MKTIIHVNQHHIKANTNNPTGELLPVYTIKQNGLTKYAHRVIINGPSEIVYDVDKTLGCGAKCWILTHSDVELFGETTFKELH